MLTGSYSDFEGVITINQVPIDNYNSLLLRSETGILFHQQDIFEGTLYENITLGDTQITPAEITQLANKIGIDDFIISLKHGFDTHIDAAGKRLSSAVMRKVLLLRALLSKPKLLLLEEPWLGFDADCKEKVQHYLLHDIPNTTVLLITNEPAFVQKCDRIIEIQDGIVVKQSKPNETR